MLFIVESCLGYIYLILFYLIEPHNVPTFISIQFDFS